MKLQNYRNMFIFLVSKLKYVLQDQEKVLVNFYKQQLHD